MPETVIRLPESQLYQDDLHKKPFLFWIQEQVDRISKYADVIIELQEETKRTVISPMKVNECAAKFTEFYVKNIAFKRIYKEFAEIEGKEAKEIYDKIYLDIKKEVTNYGTVRGAKYKKKDATQKEIEIEMSTHENYAEYKKALSRQEDYEKKADTQEDFIKGLGKLDQILSLLQRAATAELKYLYLET